MTFEILKGQEINKSGLEEHRAFSGLKKNEYYILISYFTRYSGTETEIVYHASTKKKCKKWLKENEKEELRKRNITPW